MLSNSIYFSLVGTT